MAILKIRAIAPQIDPPLQWGSNIFIGSTWDPKDQSLNSQVIQPPMSIYTFNINDWTIDTMPPFRPKPGKSFHSIKFIELVYHDAGADGMTYLNNSTNINAILPNNSIVTAQDIASGRFKLIVIGTSGGANSYIKAKVLFADTTNEYSEETLTEIVFIGTRKMMPSNMSFNPQVQLIVSNPIHVLNAYELSNLLDINMTEGGSIPYGAWGVNTPLDDIYFSILGSTIPYKIEFQLMDGCDAIEYYGNIIQVGQKIQIQAIMNGHVKIIRERLKREYNIQIGIGHSYTGHFRVTPF